MRLFSCFMLFVGLSLVASISIHSQIDEVTLDLSAWSQEGPVNNGNWEVFDTDGDGLMDEVVQNVNERITFFVSPESIGAGNEFHGRFSTSDSDDDYMGFVFGYQDADNYYVCEWKGGDQVADEFGFGEAGITVLKVSGLDPVLEESFKILWQAVDAPGAKMIEKWRTSSGGIGWEQNEIYSFKLSLFDSAIRIVVRKSDSTLVYDSGILTVDEPIEGRFGFYNLSQAKVTYSGFTQREIPAQPPTGNVMILDDDFELVTQVNIEGRYPLMPNGFAPLGTAEGSLFVALGQTGVPDSPISSVSVIVTDGAIRPILEIPEADRTLQILSMFFCGENAFALIVGPSKETAHDESTYSINMIRGPFHSSAVRQFLLH